jgi:signal transduction histidine kinase
MTDTQEIYQLENQLAAWENTPGGDIIAKIDILNDLAWVLCDIDLKRAQSLSETAYALAGATDDGAASYQTGIAYSLRTLGYLNQRVGDYPLGLTQLFKAQEIFESLKIDDALPDVLDGIAGIYFQISDFPEALTYIYRQLEAAQRLGDQRLIANANNNLANIYFETGDYNRAIETLRHNLQIATEIDYKRIESLSYLNLAETYLLAGDYLQALDNARLALAVSQAAGFELFQVYAFDLIGKAHLKLGEAAQAIHYLEQALALSSQVESHVTESPILLNLGHAYHATHQPDLALACLQRGVATAQAINAGSELFKIHLLLSEIYEQQGDFAQALVHYKEYQTIKETVLGEKSDQRLKVLQVAHDTETVRKEAEILRLKTTELQHEVAEHARTGAQLEQQVKIRTAELSNTVMLLQQEITERERAQAEIQHLLATLEQRVSARTEELATFFDLTVLAGHAANLADVFQQAIPRILEVTHSRAICLHLGEPDQPATLRLAAQHSLPAAALSVLQNVSLPPSFQRWMQHPNDPLVATNLAGLTLLPSAFRPADFKSYLGAQIRVGSGIKGLLSCYRFTESGFTMDEISLVVALAEQLGMVLETHRLRQTAQEIAVLEERQRLARDLHDSVTQSIYSLTLFARAGREAAEDGDAPRLNASLVDIEQNARHALQEMRLLLYELRAPLLEQTDLVQAIDTRLNLVERRAGLLADFQVALAQRPLPQALELELYRLTIESLNNVVKHANARRVGVDLSVTRYHLTLTITDDGCGFEPPQKSGGFGLQGMQERVDRLGGTLEIISAPGQGTKILIKVGLTDE